MISGLRVEGVTKRYGAVTALDDATLDIPDGKLVCFLGPSGCGKTTLLRIIAGLESPTEGALRLGGRDIAAEPAHRRGFGMVFQSLALFPHLSVGDNIAYSMRIAGRSRRDRAARIEELLGLVRLPGVARRHVTQLSGGQRQRIAIARALAQEPRLLLLDEPMSALDAKLREDLQVELRLLQRKLKLTTVLVTHDQREAMTMADIIVVMRAGRIEQVGAPLEVYNNPASLFVADFIGGANLLPGEAAAGGVRVGDTVIAGVATPGDAREVTVAVRGENVRLGPVNGGGDGVLTARVAFIRDVGAMREAHLECCGMRFICTMPARDGGDFSEGDMVEATLPPEACKVFPRDDSFQVGAP